MTWTPAEAQGPGTYSIVVKVTDSNPAAVNAVSLSTTNTTSVTVNEVNTTPAFNGPSGSFILDELTTLIVMNTATDSDKPANTLTFSVASAPNGAAINPVTLGSISCYNVNSLDGPPPIL